MDILKDQTAEFLVVFALNYSWEIPWPRGFMCFFLAVLTLLMQRKRQNKLLYPQLFTIDKCNFPTWRLNQLCHRLYFIAFM